jgi:putative DeoR family transcriptional regulator (stage III sporulation protein D)
MVKKPSPFLYVTFYLIFNRHIYVKKDHVNRGRGYSMKDYMRRRILETAKYMLETKATVRKAAKVFGVSKSTVHKDMTERLKRINSQLAEEVKKVLEFNKAERHIRGGRATKRKYQNTLT